MSLSSLKAPSSMIAKIHVLKSRAGMDDDTYRDFLQRETGHRSARELNSIEAGRVIEQLQRSAGGKASGAVAGLDTPIGGKLRALWIAGYDLGVVRDRTDRAMLSFVERQSKVSHVRFLKDVHAGNSAIQGLKGWLAREAKVEWPSDRFDVLANKQAILNAQWMRLIAIGDVVPWVSHGPLTDLATYAFKVVGMQGWNFFEGKHYDQVQNQLGRRLRRALANRKGNV